MSATASSRCFLAFTFSFATSGVHRAVTFRPINLIPAQDYGRFPFDVHNRFLLGGNYSVPWGISISPFLALNSGSPFNITVGQDLNERQPVQRPPLLCHLFEHRRDEHKIRQFDFNPSADSARIPYNYVTAPGNSSTNLRLSEAISASDLAPSARQVEVSNGPAPGGGGRGPGGGGPGGVGLGPGGLSSSGGRPPMLDQQASRRYS